MASVLHRTTKQYLASVNTPSYPSADWIPNPDLSAVAGVPPRYWKITGDAVTEMTEAEKNLNFLDTARQEKMDAIDSRTAELINQGFEYPPGSGNIFSLSPEMQRNLEGLNQVKDDPAVQYPIEWNVKDNSEKLSLANSAVVSGFYLTALVTVRVHRDGGTSLKDSVRAAVSVAVIVALVDSR